MRILVIFIIGIYTRFSLYIIIIKKKTKKKQKKQQQQKTCQNLNKLQDLI